MKLLQIFPTTVRGGNEEYALTLAASAIERGWDVSAAFPKTAGTLSLIEDFQHKGVRYFSFSIAELPREQETKGRDLRRWLQTTGLLFLHKPDVVFFNLPWPDICFGPLLACGCLNIPTVVVFQLVPYAFSFRPQKLALYSWLRARCQQWIAVSENNRQLLSQSFHVPEHQILRIYNGAALPFSSDTEKNGARQNIRSQVRRELGLSPSSLLLLTVGRLHPQKGYSDLIPVIPHICRDFPETHFLWVGEGPQKNVLQNMIDSYHIDRHITFLGQRSDVPRLLQAADLFIFPTHSEGLSFSLIEAMAHRLPILASDASSNPELIEHQVHGLLFRKGDSCDLLEHLRWVLRHPEDMAAMANASYRRSQDFQQAAMLEQTLDCLEGMRRA
jgi:glycosyltransferase involved in cell wall biosynthesis